jgi:hypothetical protein
MCILWLVYTLDLSHCCSYPLCVTPRGLRVGLSCCKELSVAEMIRMYVLVVIVVVVIVIVVVVVVVVVVRVVMPSRDPPGGFPRAVLCCDAGEHIQPLSVLVATRRPREREREKEFLIFTITKLVVNISNHCFIFLAAITDRSLF